MTARRIGVSPGTGDYVGAIDTDDEDSTGNAIPAQLFALISEKGEIIDLPATLDKAFGASQEILELLVEIRDLLIEIKE